MINGKFIPGKTYIPASGTIISDADKQILIDVAKSGWYTESKMCAKFRRELQKTTQIKHVTLCNSGSSANLLAVTACLEHFAQPTSKYILTTAVGFPTTIVPIYKNNLIPIFVDVDLSTLSPNLRQIERAIKKYPEICGGIFTHTMGFQYQEKAVADTLDRFRFLVSDCCDGLGGLIGNVSPDVSGRASVPIGKYATVSTYSFFPAHQLCTAEGGAVATDWEAIHKTITSYNNWGRDCWCAPGQNNSCGNRFTQSWGELPYGYDHKYVFTKMGYNLKMTEFQGALGYSQIQRLGEIVDKRRHNYEKLYNGINPSPHIRLFPPVEGYSPFGFLLMVKADSPFTLLEMVNHLEDHKVATRRLFGGNLIRQPMMKDMEYISMFDLTSRNNSDRLMSDSFWIGVWEGITDEMVDYMTNVINQFIGKYG